MISVQCQCGAKYQAKDSSAGNQFACKKCGRELSVPESQDANWEQEEELPKLPSLPAKKPKNKPASVNDEPKLPAKKRRKERETSASSPAGGWAYVLTGDIRPLMVSGGCILLGIAAIAFPFIMGPLDPKDLAKDPNAPLVSRNERLGAGIFLTLYNTFGQAGVTGFCILVGLGFIAGGVWFFRNYDGESDD